MIYQELIDEILAEGIPSLKASEREHIRKLADIRSSTLYQFLKSFIAKQILSITVQTSNETDVVALSNRKGYCQGLSYIIALIDKADLIMGEIEEKEGLLAKKQETKEKYNPELIKEQGEREVQRIIDKYKIKHNTITDKGQPESV